MLLRIALRQKMSRLTALTTAVALVMAPMPALAQGGGLRVLRDTESEQLLRDYTRPILRAAGMEKQNIQMVIINESAFNAFVADGRRIFVNYGAMMQSETPNQIIGVMAHETGASRRRPSLQAARATGGGADPDDHRHAARRRRAGRGRAGRQRQ